MAKPIAPTPLFEGEALEELIKYMKQPLPKEEEEFNDKVKKAKKISRPSLNFL
ncbi:hypothetical protein [Methanobrevibacter sp.]|uniref:hypothetical protein n=1 Tax=Methanobrevibacter sp. TaxID=66852 RepID=UPI0025EEF061|nr:hypothetical protein [Methanobrevibacter sp.]MBQ6511657.1 hypothetical protein [Methanobrevibacter sp.]